MQVTYQDDCIAVIDELLDGIEFNRLSNYLQHIRFPAKVGTITTDASPKYALQSHIYLTERTRKDFPQLAQAASERKFLQSLPSGDPCDLITGKFDALAGILDEVVGDRSYGYVRDCYRSEAGAGYAWHRDADVYTGGFVFYGSPAWDVNWGGEFMVFPKLFPSLKSIPPEQQLADFDGGKFFFPRPNRLIVIKGGTPHRVNAVAHAAKTPRFTVAGFFLTELGLKAREQAYFDNVLSKPKWQQRLLGAALGIIRTNG